MSKTQQRRRQQIKMTVQILKDNPNRRLSAREIYSEMERRCQTLVPRNPTGLGLVLRQARPRIVSDWYNGRRFYFLGGFE